MESDVTVAAGDGWKVSAWVTALRSVAGFNILLWAVVCLPLAGGSRMLSLQVALSGIYVAVCAFRSWLPRVDLERYCIEDSVWSSPVVGRSAATVAEIAFAAQIALCVHHVGEVAGVPWIAHAAYFIVPPLVLAQVFCWHSVLTLNHLGHAIENSLWTATFAGVGVCLAAAAPHLQGELLAFVVAGTCLAFGFVAFMVTVDVPMYVARWRQAHREKRRFLSLQEGFRDALFRRVRTREWSHWKPEVAWLTGYFSVAVWLSVSCVRFLQP